MKMQALVALQNFPYAKVKLKAGDTFLATPRDARILTVLKKAQLDPAGSPAAHSAPADQASVRDVVEEVMEVAPPARKRPGRAREAIAEAAGG